MDEPRIWAPTHLCRVAHLLLEVTSSAVKLLHRRCQRLERLLRLQLSLNAADNPNNQNDTNQLK